MKLKSKIKTALQEASCAVHRSIWSDKIPRVEITDKDKQSIIAANENRENIAIVEDYREFTFHKFTLSSVFISQTNVEYVKTPLQIHWMPGFTAVKLIWASSLEVYSLHNKTLKQLEINAEIFLQTQKYFWNTAHNIQGS